MKLMAIDYGKKRVGIASTDDTGHFALPRLVLSNDSMLLDKVLKFKEEHKIEQIVLGESRNLDGSPNPIQAEINQFRKSLEERGIVTISHPEVFTTLEAKHLQGKNHMIDASAAALILKSFIDTRYNKEA